MLAIKVTPVPCSLGARPNKARCPLNRTDHLLKVSRMLLPFPSRKTNGHHIEWNGGKSMKRNLVEKRKAPVLSQGNLG